MHQRRDVRIVYKECSTLAKAGYDTHLIIGDGKGDEVFRGVKIHGCLKHSNRFKRMLLGPLQILLKATELKANVYHFHDVELLPVGVILKALGYSVIYDVHDDVPKQIMGKHYISKPLKWILAPAVRCIEAVLSRRMSAIVAADPAKQKRFARYNPHTWTVHNYPLMEELLMLDTSKRDPKRVCYVGAITRIRGIIPVLDSIQPLNVKLILAGAFDPPSLEDECRRHPSWNKVEYLGFIDRVGVAEVLSRASVGMVIWLPNENYLDSLPIKMFEYMSASMPVVASNFPNLKAIIEHYGCGLCVDPYKTKDIAKAISTILSDRDLAETMGQRGHDAIVSTLNWSSQADILCELYEEVLTR